MKTAKEMFEDLEFYYNKQDYGFSYDAYNSETGWLRIVSFDLNKKEYKIHRVNIYWDYETKYTKHSKLDLAIKKQKQELGWEKSNEKK